MPVLREATHFGFFVPHTGERKTKKWVTSLRQKQQPTHIADGSYKYHLTRVCSDSYTITVVIFSWYFSLSADHEQDWQLYPVDLFLLFFPCSADHEWNWPSCKVSFVLLLLCFVFRLCAFVEAAAPCSTVLRYAGAPNATRVFHPPLLFLSRCRFFRAFCFVSFPLSLCMESTSYVLSFRIVVFYLVTTGWIFDISLCDN